MTEADSDATTARHARLGVVQLAFRPARLEWLADPFATLGEDSIFASVPPGLAPKLRELGKRLRDTYVGQLRKKIQAVLKQALAWNIKILVFPEYSLPHELLPDLLDASTDMLIVAGTHIVDRSSRRALQSLGTEAVLGQAVAPVLGGGKLLACVPKMTPSQWEPWLRLDGAWQPVTTNLPFSTRGAVLICLDFLRRHEPSFDATLLEDCRWIAVPSLTPSRSREDFSKSASVEALRKRRPVLHANAAEGGGSTIYAGSEPSDTRSFPDGVGRLQSGDEGLLVAEVDLGVQRAGVATPYDTPRLVTPFAQASFVYDSIDPGFRAWVDEVAPLLESAASAEEIVEKLERLLVQHQSALADVTGTRARRIERIKLLAPDAYDVEPLRRLAREVVLPSDVLPYPILVAALAKGASEVLQDWMRTDPACAKSLGVLQAEAARLLTARISSIAQKEVDAIASAVLGRQLVARDMYIARLEEAVEEGFDQRFADAKQLFAELKFTEALSAFVELREKAESLSLPKPQLDTRVVRCALNESACFVNLQQPDDAAGVLAALEGREVNPILRIRIAEHWAVVGDAAKARALLPSRESIAPNAEAAEAYQLALHNIEISEGILPQGRAFPPTTLSRIASLQLEQGDLQACYDTIQEILRTSSDAIIEINCAVLLSALLFKALLDDPGEHVIPVPQRIAILADCRRLFLAGQYDRLPERISSHARVIEWQVADLAGDWNWLGKLPEAENGAEERSVRELVASGQLEAARSKIRVEGPSWRPDWYLIKLLVSVSRFEEALAGILRLSEQWPRRVPIEYIAAHLLAQAGRHSEAIPRARFVFEQFPTLYHRIVLSEQLARVGSYADAWRLLEGVEGDGDARVLSLLAQVAEHCSLPAAPAYWSKYLELYPDDARAQMHRVRILAALGRFLDAADEAWALIESYWDRLTLQDIVFCGSIQVHRGAHARSNDPQHEKRIVRCIQAIRERFGAVPLAEEARLHLSSLLGHEIAAEPPIDYRLLIDAGRLKGFNIDELPTMLRSDSEAHAIRQRLYQAGAIPIETLCSSNRLRLAELFSRVTATGAQWSFCSYHDLHGDSAVPALSGIEIVVSLAELYLLAALDLLQVTREALGANGRLVVFAENFERLAQERQALAEVVSRQRQGQPLDVLQLLSRLPEDTNAPTISSNTLLVLLKEKGLIYPQQEADLKKYIPADEVDSPALASDARFRVDPFWLGRLRAIGVLQDLVRAIGGQLVRHPGDQEGLHAELEQMSGATRAYELAASLHDQLGAGASSGWVVMAHSADDPMQIGDLPTPFGEIFLEPMLDKSRYWAYLADSPAAVRVTVDAFGASVLGAPELMTEVMK
ncbi:MAG TPA: hypothetical protein VER11_15880, partial [Polyangiaceae bacterium]|nr:hypothetical protein [Polyangiaceae bacterium]